MTVLETLDQALAAQHACVFGLGAALARADSADMVLVEAALDQHTGLRDRWRAEILTLGGEPVAAQPAYRLPTLADRAAVRALLRDLDSGALAACSAVVAATGPDTETTDASRLRGVALSAMTTIVDRAGTLSTDLGTLPGVTARAARER